MKFKFRVTSVQTSVNVPNSMPGTVEQSVPSAADLCTTAHLQYIYDDTYEAQLNISMPISITYKTEKDIKPLDIVEIEIYESK